MSTTRHVRSTLLQALALAAIVSRSAVSEDYLIVPGVRVGPIQRTSTEVSLRASLGKAITQENVDVGEGVQEPGLIIYKDDPTRRLAVVWNGETPKRPSTVFVCYGATGTSCRYHTASGIRVGTTLKDLERRNHRPFEMVGWGSDVGGNIVSFKGGALDRELKISGGLLLSVYPRINAQGDYIPKLTAAENSAVQGEKFLDSSHPVLQKLNPYVTQMILSFSAQGGNK